MTGFPIHPRQSARCWSLVMIKTFHFGESEIGNGFVIVARALPASIELNSLRVICIRNLQRPREDLIAVMSSLLRWAFVRERTWNSHVFIAEPALGDGNQCVAKGAAVEVTTSRRRGDHRDAMIVVGLVSVKMAREHCRDLCLPEEAQ